MGKREVLASVFRHTHACAVKPYSHKQIDGMNFVIAVSLNSLNSFQIMCQKSQRYIMKTYF